MSGIGIVQSVNRLDYVPGDGELRVQFPVQRKAMFFSFPWRFNRLRDPPGKFSDHHESNPDRLLLPLELLPSSATILVRFSQSAWRLQSFKMDNR